MKMIASFSSILLSLAILSPAADPETSSEAPEKPYTGNDLAGIYYRGDDLALNVTVRLNADGSYSASWHGCVTPVGAATGKWTVKGDTIMLKPKTLSETESQDSSRKHLLRKLTIGRFNNGAFYLLPESDTDYQREQLTKLGVTRGTAFLKLAPTDTKEYRRRARMFTHEEVTELIAGKIPK